MKLAAALGLALLGVGCRASTAEPELAVTSELTGYALDSADGRRLVYDARGKGELPLVFVQTSSE